MHSAIELPKCAAPGCRTGLRVLILSLLGLGLGSHWAGAQKAPEAKGEYVGAAVCATCHVDEAKNFPNNPHHKLALLHGPDGPTCEACHGPGKEHVDGGGDKSKIFAPSEASAKELDARCLSCHAKSHPDYARSAHGEGQVSCIGCHSIHAAKVDDHLLKAKQPELCYQCHSEVRPQFSMPFHHKVGEGLMQCSDCHNPHGTPGEKMLRSTSEQNAVCVKCHSETAGPFVHEHPVVKAEGCTSCHTPHGSPNARLLNVSNVNTLCLQCHSVTNSAAFPHAVAPTGPQHSQIGTYVACTSCHTQIHGSNTSDVFFK